MKGRGGRQRPPRFFCYASGAMWWRSEDTDPDIMSGGGSVVLEFGHADSSLLSTSVAQRNGAPFVLFRDGDGRVTRVAQRRLVQPDAPQRDSVLGEAVLVRQHRGLVSRTLRAFGPWSIMMSSLKSSIAE